MKNNIHSSNKYRPSSSTPRVSLGAGRMVLGLSMLIVVSLLAACGGSTPTPLAIPSVPALPTNLPTTVPVTGSTQGAATALDPCQLIPSQEASSLAGTTFGPGKDETDVGGLKTCTYGAQTTNVFTVEVVQAPDIATAKNQLGQFMATLQASIPQLTAGGMTITQLPNLGDGAVMGQANLAAINVNAGAIGVSKGTVFFGFSDLVQGGPAPTSQALQDEITKVLGRLP